MNEITLSPLGKDIVVERVDDSEANETNIYLDDKDDTEIQHYRVLRVGPDVELVQTGDKVIMSWAKITPPFRHDGKKIGITNEAEVLGVFEDGEY